MKIIVEATPKEIAALAAQLQGRQDSDDLLEEVRRLIENMRTRENLQRVKFDEKYRESLKVPVEESVLFTGISQEILENEQLGGLNDIAKVE